MIIALYQREKGREESLTEYSYSDPQASLHSKMAIEHFRLFHDSRPGLIGANTLKQQNKTILPRQNSDSSGESDEDEHMIRVKSVVLDGPPKPIRSRAARGCNS